MPPVDAVEGTCQPAFAAVQAAFRENFARRGEVGAAVAVEVDGKPVVDLWGGIADPASGTPWTRDTVCVVFSNTKPATALCAHRLAEQGALDLDRPVADVWPAFAANGKGSITTRMLLDHTAGLPVVRAPLGGQAAFDWERMVRALEAEAPFWTPGSRVGYHAITFGWLVGEVVRRVSGVPLGTFFQGEIAAPLALDFWIGLPAQHEHRVAPIEPPAPSPTPRTAFERAVAEEPGSIPALYLRNSGGWRPTGFNSRAGHAAEIGAAGGIANARALARLYGCLACGGARDSYRLLREDTVAAATEVSAASHLDATLLVPTRFSAGFMRQMDNRRRGLDSAVFGLEAFGHCGAGGSLAFAAPRHRLSFAYVMNRIGPGVLLNERAHALVRACYDALGSAEGP